MVFTLEYKFPCDLCDHNATQRSGLALHKKRVHALIEETPEGKEIPDKLNEMERYQFHTLTLMFLKKKLQISS